MDISISIILQLEYFKRLLDLHNVGNFLRIKSIMHRFNHSFCIFIHLNQNIHHLRIYLHNLIPLKQNHLDKMCNIWPHICKLNKNYRKLSIHFTQNNSLNYINSNLYSFFRNNVHLYINKKREKII